MPHRVLFVALAKNQMRVIDRITAMRILLALTRLIETGQGDIKALEGYDPPQLRLRVGDYRVRYRPIGSAIQVLAVAHRSQAYR